MNEQIESMRHAREVIQWMSLGIVPSQENAQIARDNLVDHDVPQAQRVLAAIEMGLAPKAQLCLEAAEQVDEAIDAYRDFSRAQLRERSRN